MKAGRASSTAGLIARAMALLFREPCCAGLVDRQDRAWWDAAARMSVAGRAFVPLIEWSAFRRLLWFLEGSVLPGIVRHYALRKRTLRGQVIEAVEHGFRQLVVLGAGYDPMPLRISQEWPLVKCFELDFPATQHRKVGLLQQFAEHTLGAVVSQPALLPLDLEQTSFSNALRSAGVSRPDPASPTLIVAEGLFMYLEPDRVRAILTDAADYFSGPVRFAFTFLETDDIGAPRFRTGRHGVAAYLRSVNEPFRWGVTPDAIADFLPPPFVPLSIQLPEGEGEAGALGEWICVAERPTDLRGTKAPNLG